MAATPDKIGRIAGRDASGTRLAGGSGRLSMQMCPRSLHADAHWDCRNRANRFTPTTDFPRLFQPACPCLSQVLRDVCHGICHKFLARTSADFPLESIDIQDERLLGAQSSQAALPDTRSRLDSRSVQISRRGCTPPRGGGFQTGVVSGST
jgi:hypothetical protein